MRKRENRYLQKEEYFIIKLYRDIMALIDFFRVNKRDELIK